MDKESEPEGYRGVPTDILVEELGLAASHQAALIGRLQSRYGGENSRVSVKDKEIAVLRAQLADARVEAASANASARKLADEKMSLLVQVIRERAELANHQTNYFWALKYRQQSRERFFCQYRGFSPGCYESSRG